MNQRINLNLYEDSGYAAYLKAGNAAGEPAAEHS
jgi:hypothetical protein